MRALVFTVLVAGSISSHGQQYFPFPDSNAVWHVLTVEGMVYKQQFHYFDYVMQGDTLIDSMPFAKLYMLADDDPIYIGAIREDSSRRVYFHGNLYEVIHSLYQDTTMEYLLYDFSLDEGDTIAILTYDHSGDPLVLRVDHFDSVEVAGELRRTTFVSGQWWIDEWIEGIGSVAGILFPYYWQPFEGDWELFCFEQGGKYVYPDTTFEGCIATGIENVLPGSFFAYPNPTSGLLTVSLLEVAGPAGLTIINILGQAQLHESVVVGSRQFQLDLTSLSSGLYIITLTDGVQSWRAKVVKR